MASVGEANQKRVVAVRQEVTGPAARVRSSGSRPPSAGTALQTAQEEVTAAEKAYEATASCGKKAMTAEQRALRKAAKERLAAARNGRAARSPQSREGAAGCGTQSAARAAEESFRQRNDMPPLSGTVRKASRMPAPSSRTATAGEGLVATVSAERGPLPNELGLQET